MAFADEEGLQPRRKPPEYRVRDHELDRFAERDDWTLDRNFPATIMAAGLTLAVEGLVLDGLVSGRALVGALLAVASGLWLAWATNQELPRQRLVREIRTEAEELRERAQSDLGLVHWSGLEQSNLARILTRRQQLAPDDARSRGTPAIGTKPPTE